MQIILIKLSKIIILLIENVNVIEDKIRIIPIIIIISVIKDRIQPVFSDFNSAHVTFYIMNKYTLSYNTIKKVKIKPTSMYHN